MPELKRSLGFWDGLAMVVGIMVGTGIFRTPGLVAQRLGRPALTFVAWAAGGAIAFLGALIFAELATRHPNAGGKYVYAREAFGKRAGFVVGWIEGLVYAVATAAIGVVAGNTRAGSSAWATRAGSPPRSYSCSPRSISSASPPAVGCRTCRPLRRWRR